MGRVGTLAAALLVAGFVAGCTGSPEASSTPAAVVANADTGFATAQDGTRISYRDWGGQGLALVLLTGLGDTAAIYDDLASRLVDRYRVVGITRRGFGESGKPADGYDYTTRVSDDLAVLAELGIDEAVFVGHGIAGDELLALAADHPDRTLGVVFLDAAFPIRTDPLDTPTCINDAGLWMPGWVVGPDDPVQSGIAQAERVFGFPLPPSFASEIEASYDFAGGVAQYTGSPGAIQAIDEYSSANPQNFGSVAVPALSVAAVSNTLSTALPWMTEGRVPDQDRAAAQACTDDVVVRDQQAQFAAVAAANPAIEAQQWEQTHTSLYLQQPERTVSTIKEWLAGR